MGNRAVVTFDKHPNDKSIGVYLHWNGGPESVLAFAESLDAYGVRDNDDPPFQLARFIQIVANFFGGTTSIGVDRLENLDCDNGDNGLYVITRQDGTLTIEHYPSGMGPHKHKKPGYGVLDKHEIKQRHASYWTPQHGSAQPPMMEQIFQKNDKHFKDE